MKKIIRIIIMVLILLTVILLTKSNAAIECKGENPSFLGQLPAFKLFYDMRNPTSSLGINTLEPHLELNKDYGTWAYLGMSTYGNNGRMGGNSCSTPNATGIVVNTYQCGQEITAGIVDPFGESSIVQQYGNSKYLEKFDTTEFTIENTKGMALAETYGWYMNANDGHGVLSGIATIMRVGERNWSGRGLYDYLFTDSWGGTCYARPVIWN